MSKYRPWLDQRLDWLLSTKNTDADLVRRGRLLSILLLACVAAALVFVVIGFAVNVSDGWVYQDEVLLFVISVIATGFVFALYCLNRVVSTRLASIVFLLGSVILISFSDDPQQLIAGRSTMLYVFPIVMASVLLAPSTSFVMAALSGVSLFALAATNNLLSAANLSTIFVEIILFLILALVSWLSARSLEQALTGLRTVNAELDHRVADRTRDLAEALIRVQMESSKSQAILESIADGVIVFDGLGKATVVNPAISRLLNLPPDQIVGYRIETLMAGVVGVNDQKAVLDQLRNQESSIRLPGLRLQWGNKTLSASFAPIQIQQEIGRGTVAVFRDYTREAELDRMKTMFVSMVSHELRTPLGAIMGYGEILQEQVHGPLNERQLNVVERLIANTKRLLSLVNDLLDRARLEAGRLKLMPAPFAPEALMEELVSTIGQMAAAKKLELITSIAPEVPQTLIGDSQRLMQILINLVTNAIKFTDHGSITVKFDRADRTRWSLQVSDTGIGIPPDEQVQVFDMFRQVDGLTTRRQGGAGLGLSIVKQLVTLMGGDIQLVSSVDVGSTFTIVLPLNHTMEGARD
ncbi:MAG TPA: ATP-binding protein [Anaerolineae bacterium]|nr:ATP-binding protein [Anaerolineae bacterium]